MLGVWQRKRENMYTAEYPFSTEFLCQVSSQKRTSMVLILTYLALGRPAADLMLRTHVISVLGTFEEISEPRAGNVGCLDSIE